MIETRVDIAILGGGTGAVAAALAATSHGKKVIITEETDWLGGQLTSQGVPPDEHPWIESFGCTGRYREFRRRVREYHQAFYPLHINARMDTKFNPGDGSVSRLCAEPRVYHFVLESMMSYAVSKGLLDVRLGTRLMHIEMDGDEARCAKVSNLCSGDGEIIYADYFLDATELGDGIKSAGVEYVTGAESQRQTGELHAASVADENNVQALTWCFAMGYDPDGNHIIDRPDNYDYWKSYNPNLTPPWPGKMFDWTYTNPISLEPITASFDPLNCDGSFWRYRRLIGRSGYAEGCEPNEVVLVNWPQNDYIEGNIIDASSEKVCDHLRSAREMSMSLFYWMQTEAPRPDGGEGFPGLYLCPNVLGTRDGFAKAPYIRESRRIRAVSIVTEEHVGLEARGSNKAESFADSVGVGCYRIDLHPSTGRDNYIDVASIPFQIPLSALVPERVRNVLPACKNIGTTHITNGCYRLHPVEWNIGEAAGMMASFCIDGDCSPQQICEDIELLQDLQRQMLDDGFELEWPEIHPV